MQIKESQPVAHPVALKHFIQPKKTKQIHLLVVKMKKTTKKNQKKKKKRQWRKRKLGSRRRLKNENLWLTKLQCYH